jgi:hypothetical protein
MKIKIFIFGVGDYSEKVMGIDLFISAMAKNLFSSLE